MFRSKGIILYLSTNSTTILSKLLIRTPLILCGVLFLLFMQKTTLFLVTIFVFLITACEEPVDMDIPQAEITTVAYASQSYDDTLQVYIARTRHIYDTARYTGCDSTAEAFVIHNGNQTPLRYNGKRFIAEGLSAHPGDTISIQVTGTDSKHTFAQTIIPKSIIAHSIEITPSALLIDDVYFSRVQLSFDDPSDETNYYEFSLKVTQIVDDSSTSYGYHYFRSFDPIMVSEDIMQYEPITMLFSDAMFNGSQVSIPMYYFLYFYTESLQKVIVVSELRSVTKEHYHYYKTLYKSIYNQSGIWSGMTLPVSISGNVENGAGLFSLFTSTRDTVVYDFK